MRNSLVTRGQVTKVNIFIKINIESFVIIRQMDGALALNYLGHGCD